MAAHYTNVTLAQMQAALKASKGWKAVKPEVHEHVFGWKVPHWPGVFVLVYTGIDKEGGKSRAKGKDAIRVCAVDVVNDRGVIKTKRVHRTQNWEANMQKRVLACVKHAGEVMERRKDKGEWKAPAVDIESTEESYPRPCPKCHTTGTYGWGACVNGVMEHTGKCFACDGKGQQTLADAKRCETYWGHKLAEGMSADMGKPLDPEDFPAGHGDTCDCETCLESRAAADYEQRMHGRSH